VRCNNDSGNAVQDRYRSWGALPSFRTRIGLDTSPCQTENGQLLNRGPSESFAQESPRKIRGLILSIERMRRLASQMHSRRDTTERETSSQEAWHEMNF
jgi:hypothetical protein